MNMQQCPNGHFYDMSKSAQCPYCSTATENGNRTVPLGAEFTAPPQNAFSNTAPVNVFNSGAGDVVGRTVPVMDQVSNQGHTVAVLKKKIGLDPVVGWLVCVDGKVRGQDYRIKNGNNVLGSSESMDIQIAGDDTISKVDMAYVTYDAETKTYLVVAGKGKNVVRVNGELLPVSQSRELHANDRIKLGETTLMFVPFCGEAFDWA